VARASMSVRDDKCARLRLANEAILHRRTGALVCRGAEARTAGLNAVLRSSSSSSSGEGRRT
jgi:hypothetical protein